MKVGLVSLGCAKNRVDSELILGLLGQHGYTVTDEPHDAEVLIVNSCGFIEQAKVESIDTLLRLVEYKRNGNCKVLVLAGCLGQRYSGELLNELPEVDAIVGTGSWNRMPEAILEALAGRRPLFTSGASILPDADMPRVLTTPIYYAYVKIAEGCNHACSFCAIPQIRGPLISRTVESIRSEVTMLVADGAKEVNLVAQDTTSYGLDLYGRPMLVELLRELVKIDGYFRIRLLYSYPKNFTNELIQLMHDEPKICNYVDIPLQHVNDELLKSMRRPDRRRDIESLIVALRKSMPDVAVRTTFIVGLPGETSTMYEELREFIETHRLDHVGIFKYSPEENTPAAGFPDQIAEDIKEERYNELMAIQAGISEEINRKAEGLEYEALIEGHDVDDPSLGFGRTEREAPDIDGTVYVEHAEEVPVGEFVKVKIIQGFCYDRMAEVVKF